LRETAARFAEAIRRGLWAPRSKSRRRFIAELLPNARKEIAWTGIPIEADEAENARHREKARKHKAAREKIMATKTGEKGLLIVNTGSGKGKTSAALGMVFRHIGHGYPVAVVQFTKSPAWDTGEAKVLANFLSWLTLHIMGEGFTWETQDRETRHLRRRQGLERAKGADPRRPPPHGVARRSSTSCCAMITSIINEVLTFLREEKPADKHVVITGRNAKPELDRDGRSSSPKMTLVKHSHSARGVGKGGGQEKGGANFEIFFFL